MRRAILATALAGLPLAATAQMSVMPQEVQDRLNEIAPDWGSDIRGNVAITLELYTPILAEAPRDGVEIERDISYGDDERHVLDIHARDGIAGAPVVVYLHGGAYVAGHKDVNEEVYGNVATYFARQDMVGVNATYRLAPAATWPAAAEDVGALVEWLVENVEEHGGDPERIYLIGHSAGAAHAATYMYHPEVRPDAPRIAGAVLMSGRYHFDPSPDDPNLANFQAYFGEDATRYEDMSPINHVEGGPDIPVFVVIAEYDNPDLDTQGALLYAEICQARGACPRFEWMEHHNHLSMVYQFNTEDREMGEQILDFIERGK
jgi:acetyl esterase